MSEQMVTPRDVRLYAEGLRAERLTIGTNGKCATCNGNIGVEQVAGSGGVLPVMRAFCRMCSRDVERPIARPPTSFVWPDARRGRPRKGAQP